MTMNGNSAGAQAYSFLLVPEYSMIAFSAALEALRMANQLSGRTLYRWEVLSYDGAPVAASNGVTITPDRAATEVGSVALVAVCGGNGIERTADPRLPAWLREQGRRGAEFAGVCTGSYLLAKAGLLDDYRCTVHWEYIAAMRELFPRVRVCDEVFAIDRTRYTCAGGNAPLDMMLHFITQRHGRSLAAAISEEFLCEHIRDDQDRQRIPLQTRLGANHPKLRSAVALMEANIEEPIDLDELARYVALSRRQLERLFQQHLGQVPSRYYLELRLSRARQLLRQTELSIAVISVVCGFVSSPHFSKCYRAQFGIAPREERWRERAGGIAAAGSVPEAQPAQSV